MCEAWLRAACTGNRCRMALGPLKSVSRLVPFTHNTVRRARRWVERARFAGQMNTGRGRVAFPHPTAHLKCTSLGKVAVQYYESHNNCPRFSSRRPHFVLTSSSPRPFPQSVFYLTVVLFSSLIYLLPNKHRSAKS